MADVFISYAREEQQRVRQLVAALERRGLQVWVDWGSIPPSAEWKAEISSGIEGADVFVALLTCAYAQSGACAEELAHAVSQSKRMVPIAAERLEGPEVPPELARINWLWWRDSDDVEGIIDDLVRVIEIDLEWVRAHTRLLVRAREWQNGGRDPSLLLRGRDLTAMEHWLAGKHVDPSTTPDQIQYIVHSRNSATRRQRVLAGAISLALLITAALAVTAEFMRREADKQAEISLTRQLAAQSTLVRERNVDQLQYATLLAAEGVKRSIARGLRVSEPEQALRAALDVLPGKRMVVTGAAKAIAASDGVSLLTIDPAGVGRLHHLDRAGESRELAHAGERIEQSAFSPSGAHLITATAAGTVRLWGVRPITNLSTHNLGAAISALAVTYDAFAAAVDGTVSVWNVPTGEAIASLPVGHQVTVLALFHDADHQLELALAGPAGKVTITLVNTGAVAAVLDVTGSVVGIGISPDGRRLIVEERQPHTVVFDPEEGTTQIPTPEGRTFKVWEVSGWKAVALQADGPGPEQGRHVSLAPGAVDPQSRWLASGSVYRAAQIWDVESGRRINWLDDVDFVSALQFSEDAHWLTTGTSNGTVSIWELGSQGRGGNLAITRVSTFKTDGPVRALFLDPGRLNLIVHGGSTVTVWRIGQETITIRERDVRGVEFVGDHQLAVLSGGTRAVADMNSGIVLTREPIATSARRHPRAAATSQSGRFVAARQGASDIEVKDAGSGSVLSRFSIGVEISGIFLSPDGRWLVAQEAADRVSVWETATGRRVLESFEYFDDYALQFSPNSELIAVNDGTKTVLLRALPEGRLVATLEHPGDSFSHCEFSASGAWLITTALFDEDKRDYRVRVWRADGSRAGFVDDTATAARVSADGRMIAAGYKDGRVTLFDATTGTALMTSIVHDAAVTSLSFSADERWLAAAAGDRVQVFDTRNRSEIARLRSQGPAASMAFSQDGRWLATAAWEAAQVWRLRPDELFAEACGRLQRDFTESEWRAVLGNAARRPTCQK